MQSVKYTLQEYGKICSGEITEDSTHIMVELEPKEELDKKTLEMEFSNYCLASMKQNGKQPK